MNHLDNLIKRYPQLEINIGDVNAAFSAIAQSFSNGGKLLIAGNGGSAADAEHIAGELMKDFIKKRSLPESFINKINKENSDVADKIVSHLQPGLPAIALTSNISLNTAVINDIDGSMIFAQQVYSYGMEGDVFLGISTSGNAKNILYAAAAAKAKNIKFIALTGGNGGRLKNIADISIIVPGKETYLIQELHLPVYHCLCMMLEDYFF